LPTIVPYSWKKSKTNNGFDFIRTIYSNNEQFMNMTSHVDKEGERRVAKEGWWVLWMEPPFLLSTWRINNF